MILDEDSTERSALYALEMLDADERSRFERDARINPDLAACTAEFRDVGASVALAACRRLEPPPLTVLTGALERVGAVVPRRQRRHFSSSAWPRILAAAAGLVLLVGGGVQVLHFVSDRGRDPGSSTPAAAAGVAGEDKIVIVKDGQTIATHMASDREIREMLDRLNRLEKLRPAPDMIQDIARLKRELKSLRKVDAERFSAGPRVARTVYIEMVEPGALDSDSKLSERVTDYVATAVELEVGAEQAGGSEPIDGGPDAEGKEPIIFSPEDSGAIPELNDLGEDTPFFYREFPAGNDRFERIDDGRVWDALNGRIWVETDEPGLFQAIMPPANFDPDFIDDYKGLIPEAGTLPAPIPAMADEVPAPEPEAIQEAEAVVDPIANQEAPAAAVAKSAPPTAVTIYEETTGRGSVVIGNLPPAADGTAYHLWMRNAADDQVVGVGMLPPLEDGSERFEFDLLGSGITPAGFFLTLEPEGPVDSPGENVILQGP